MDSKNKFIDIDIVNRKSMLTISCRIYIATNFYKQYYVKIYT